MGTWTVGDTTFEVDTHGNMRMFRDTVTGRIWLVRVECYFDYAENTMCVEVHVDGTCINTQRWHLYQSGIMRRNELPSDWGLSTGFGTAWRHIKNELKKARA